MIRFAELFAAWDRTNSTNRRVASLKNFFQQATTSDAVWATYFLLGNRPKGLVKRAALLSFGVKESRLPQWLFEETYRQVGDMGETITLLTDDIEGTGEDFSLTSAIERYVLPLQGMKLDEQEALLRDGYYRMPVIARLPFLKLVTGSFRTGVSRGVVIQALADLTKLAKTDIAARLTGTFLPTPDYWERLIAPEASQLDTSQPYPFFLASPIEGQIENLGSPEEWYAEWKWDGIRGQLVKRAGKLTLWSRGEEIVTEQFPEIALAGKEFPDGTVIDGEIMAMDGELPKPFQSLQERLGRKNPSREMLEKTPLTLVCYDLLEVNGVDIRERPLEERRRLLEQLLGEHESPRFRLSPLVPIFSWDAARALREDSRNRRVEGFLLKRKSSPYQVGRRRGDWWKWKVDPYSFDGVLLYAQSGRGKRASLYTDLTFGVWNEEGVLVPVAKAYSGLTNEEIEELDRWIRRHIKEKFGPVRSVTPEHVFELGFEGIQASPRHKSGIALRFPRILRWRKDKKAAEADKLVTLQHLLLGTAA
jgi:DNA ligase-1